MYASNTTVKFLIEEYKMDPSHRNKDGKNAFLVALSNDRYRWYYGDRKKDGRIEILRYLDKIDSDLKKDRSNQNETALDLALKLDDVDRNKTLNFLTHELGLK